MIHHLLTSEAPYLQPDGLPSWWPFWSDCLVSNVRDAVRAARTLEEVESQQQLPGVSKDANR
jgi:hypothetical protein